MKGECEMQEQYKYLPHTADVKFEAYGISLRDLFRNAALAACNAMYETKKVEAKKTLQIELRAESKEQLLHKFLEEILFRIDTERMLFRDFNLVIDEKLNSLRGEIAGEEINAEKHTVKALVKAITWHQFELQKTPSGWKCTVIIDV